MHTISGLIAEAAVIDRIAIRLGLPAPTILFLGFSFLPLDNENLDKIVGVKKGDPVEGFDYLTSDLIEAFCHSSQDDDFAYVETEYFGGLGTQGAAVFQSGGITFGPVRAEIGPINDALAMLGVRSGSLPDDAFERVGLGRYRNNEAIRKAAGPPMKINGLELPSELEADLRAGGLKLDEKSVKLLKRILGYTRFGHSCPYFLNLKNIEGENGIWLASRKDVEPFVGKRSFIRRPGSVDPKKILNIAILDTDTTVALDYRSRTPRVVYNEEKSGNWRVAASSYRELKRKLGLPLISQR